METNNCIYENPFGINETNTINVQFQKITDFTREWCSTILNISKPLVSIRIEKNKLQYYLNIGIVNLECVNEINRERNL